MASTAAWGRGEWSAMVQSVNLLPRDSQDGAFYRAVLCAHNQDWDQADQLIDITRDMLDTELTALSAESYQRAYPIMVQLQMLSELEEAIQKMPAFIHTLGTKQFLKFNDVIFQISRNPLNEIPNDTSCTLVVMVVNFSNGKCENQQLFYRLTVYSCAVS